MNKAKKTNRGEPLLKTKNETADTPQERDYLTLKEACKYAGVSQGTLRKYKNELIALGSVCSPKGYQIRPEHLHQAGIIKSVKSRVEDNLTLDKLNELKDQIAELKKENAELKQERSDLKGERKDLATENKDLRENLKEALKLQAEQSQMIYDYQTQMKALTAPPEKQAEPEPAQASETEDNEKTEKRSFWRSLFG